jgi:type IV fimbrial biogenesis protein FimT
MTRHPGSNCAARARSAGFTLVELLVVVAVLSILALVAGPSLNDFIRLQRLKAVTAQLTTDLQFARTEAAARNQPVRLSFSDNASVSCYVLYLGTANACTCTAAPVCGVGATEIRTVSVRRSSGVRVIVPALPGVERVRRFGFDPATGALFLPPSDGENPNPDQVTIDTEIDAQRRYRTQVKLSGRPGVCRPAGSSMEAAAC